MNIDYKKIADSVMENQLVEKKDLTPASTISNTNANLSDKVDLAIHNQVDRRLNELQDDTTFQDLSNRVTDKQAEVKLKQAMLESLNQEQQNEYTEYLLKCEKEKLEYRKKKEKKLIKEEVKAEVQNRKIKALQERFGYLYKDKTSFVPSKIYNIMKEIANTYENSSILFKKVVKATLRIVFILLICLIIYKYGRGFLQWLFSSINFNNLIGE